MFFRTVGGGSLGTGGTGVDRGKEDWEGGVPGGESTGGSLRLYDEAEGGSREKSENLRRA